MSLFSGGAERDATYEANARESESIATTKEAEGDVLIAEKHRNFAKDQRSRIGRSRKEIAGKDALSLIDSIAALLFAKAPKAGASVLTARGVAVVARTSIAAKAASNAVVYATNVGANRGRL